MNGSVVLASTATATKTNPIYAAFVSASVSSSATVGIVSVSTPPVAAAIVIYSVRKASSTLGTVSISSASSVVSS